MTTVRKQGPTPGGGDYTLATYINFDTMEEVDQQQATGLVIAEYLRDGTWIRETVGRYSAPKTAKPNEPTPEETLAKAGIKLDQGDGNSDVIFVGPQGAAWAAKQSGR